MAFFSSSTTFHMGAMEPRRGGLEQGHPTRLDTHNAGQGCAHGSWNRRLVCTSVEQQAKRWKKSGRLKTWEAAPWANASPAEFHMQRAAGQSSLQSESARRL
jgi:hypothetical protein